MDMRRKIEEAEETMHQRQNEQADAANKTQQQANQAAQELEQQKLQLQDMMNQRDNDTKYQIALLSAQGTEEAPEEDGIENPLDRDKFNLDADKARADHAIKMRQLDQDMIKHKDDMAIKKESNSIQRIQKKRPSA
jgi:hypothetical protein